MRKIEKLAEEAILNPATKDRNLAEILRIAQDRAERNRESVRAWKRKQRQKAKQTPEIDVESFMRP